MTAALADAAPRRFRLSDVVRDVPAAVWVATAAFVALGVVYTVLLPTYRAPDEIVHFDLVYGLRTGEGIPEPRQRLVTPEVQGSAAYLDFDAAEPEALAAGEAPPRDDRPSFDETAVPGSTMYNWVSNHPPLYYLLTAGLLLVTPGALDWAFDALVAYLRVLNVLLVAPLPLLVFAAARRLGVARPVAVAAAMVPLAVPMLLHVAGSVNNDNLLNLLCALLAVVLVHVATGDTSWRTAGWAGIVLGLTLLTKGFGLAVLPWPVAAYLLAWRRSRGSPPWGPALLAAGLPLLLGGWWWVRNVVVFGALQPIGTPPLQPIGPGPFPGGTAYWVDLFARFLVERWWGSFGYADTPLPRLVVVGGTAVVGIGVLLALLLRHGERRSGRPDVVVLLLPTLLVGGLVAYGAYGTYAVTGIPGAIQGRYLYAGFTGTAVSAVLGYGLLLGRRARVLPLAVWVGAVMLHAVAVVTVLDRYWGTEGVGGLEAVRAVLAWAPWPPTLSAVVATLAVVAAGALGALAGRSAFAGGEPPRTPDRAAVVPAPARGGRHRR